MKNKAICSGWKGNINGHIDKTNSNVKVSQVRLELDYDTAWALCNVLTFPIDKTLIDKNQGIILENLGAAIGQIIDHDAKNNIDKRDATFSL